MMFLLVTILPVALAGGYASAPNVSPALSAYGSPYGGYQNSYAGNQYASGNVYSPYGVNGVYGGANSYNLGFQPHPFLIYGNQNGYGNNYQQGYQNNYNTGRYNAGNAYTVEPYAGGFTQAPNYNTGVTAIPTIGPFGGVSSGAVVGALTGSPYTGGPSFGGVTPAGILPTGFSSDPWAAISAQPIVRGVSTKLLKDGKDKEVLVNEETKKKAKA